MHRYSTFNAAHEINEAPDWIVDDNKYDKIFCGKGKKGRFKAELIAFAMNCLTLGFRRKKYYW